MKNINKSEIAYKTIGETAKELGLVDKKTGQVFKPASWNAPAKHVRFDLRIINNREFLFNPEFTGWAGGYLYLR